MALRFMDSFNHYGTSDLLGTGNGQKWSLVYGSAATTCSISLGCGRFGAGLSFGRNAPTASWWAAMIKTLDNQSTWIVGFAFRTTAIPNNTNGVIVALFDSGNTQCDLRINTDGTLQVTRNGTNLTGGKSANVIQVNTWYYVEWYCVISSSLSSNQCNVNVNGVQWLSVSPGQVTKNTANATANQIAIGGTANALGFQGNGIMDYSDLYVCDGTGSAPYNTFLGDCKVECRWPIGPSGTNANWVANGGSTTGCVNDLMPNGDNSYLSSANTNDVSTFILPPLDSTPSIIYGLQVTHASRKTDAGTRQISDMVRSGGANYVGNTVSLSNGYLMFPNIYTTDPNTSAAWTQSGANAVEIGVKEIT
jgi:hypothetical protein